MPLTMLTFPSLIPIDKSIQQALSIFTFVLAPCGLLLRDMIWYGLSLVAYNPKDMSCISCRSICGYVCETGNEDDCIWIFVEADPSSCDCTVQSIGFASLTSHNVWACKMIIWNYFKLVKYLWPLWTMKLQAACPIAFYFWSFKDTINKLFYGVQFQAYQLWY